MSEMSKKFQRSRWCEVRRQVDAMRPGETLQFTLDKYFRAKASVEHLGDAYDGERPPWKMLVENGHIVITHGNRERV